MAIASAARDDETIRAGIERWIRAHEPDATADVVEPLTRPAAGLSSDTSFVTALAPDGARRSWVVRLPPAGDGLFPHYDLGLCRLCGCWLDAKVRLQHGVCPEGKWGEIADC